MAEGQKNGYFVNVFLKVARPGVTDFKTKKLFGFEIISRRSEGVSEKIEYVAVSTPRDLSIPALFFLESQNFHVYHVDKNVVSKNPRDIFGISLVLVAKT